jgi:hypothetical protein
VDTDAIDDSCDSREGERSNVELVALGEDVHQVRFCFFLLNSLLIGLCAAGHRSDRAPDPRPLPQYLGATRPTLRLLSSTHEEELLSALLVSPEIPLYTTLLIVLRAPTTTISDSRLSPPPRLQTTSTQHSHPCPLLYPPLFPIPPLLHPQLIHRLIVIRRMPLL